MSDDRRTIEMGCINEMYPEMTLEDMDKLRRLIELRVAVRKSSLNDLFQRNSRYDYVKAYRSMIVTAYEFLVCFNDLLGGFADLVADLSAGKVVKSGKSS